MASPASTGSAHGSPSSSHSSDLSSPPASPGTDDPAPSISQGDREMDDELLSEKDDMVEEKKRKAVDNSSEAEDSDGEFEEQRKVKKAKKAKGKGKGKGKSRTKGQGKGKNAKGKDKVEVKLVEKKTVRAKIITCQDLPEWEEGSGCPLLEMPDDVLDRCFGISQDLELRDWISLAGVNRFFRDSLDDPFFHELWYLNGTEAGSKKPTKMIRDMRDRRWPYTLTAAHANRPVGHPASHPFTRDITSWRLDPAAINPSSSTLTKDAITAKLHEPFAYTSKHYTPFGPRAEWTREQYTVYKEEKTRFGEGKRQQLIRITEDAAMRAKAKMRKTSIKVGQIKRLMLGVVMGRKEGEDALKKNKVGLPYETGEEEKEGMPRLTDQERKAMELEILVKEEEGAARMKAYKPRLSKEGKDLWDFAQLPKWIREAQPGSIWEVPDSESEEEEEGQHENEETVEYDEDGARKSFNHWPSKWRLGVAEEVNGTWINQTAAMKEFRLTKSELLGLRHVLVSNPLNTKQPQHMYLKAAIEALAYRSHGGHQGHANYEKESLERAKLATASRQEKIDQARADGKVIPERKHIPDPAWKIDALRYGFFDDYGPKDRPCSKKCWCKTGGWH